MGRRLALLIATYEYQDAGLQQLTAPAHDAEALAAVLEDPQIAGFDVTMMINEPHHRVGEAIGDFYRDRRHDDLTLLYFSGHGLKDEDGRLYLAMTNTRRDSLLFTGLSAEQIDQAMEGCVSRQKVLMLDCCYSGAFPADRISKADTAVHTVERFQGRGRTVLTASDALQYSFEGGRLHGQAPQSVFTRHVVAGLRDGSADLDGDGDITIDELYSYVHDRVVEEMPQQRPKKQDNVEGRTVIAKNVNWTLPVYLRNAIRSPLATDRLAALDGLVHLFRVGNDTVRGHVREQIAVLADDDSKQVSAAATVHLNSTLAPAPVTSEEPRQAAEPSVDETPRSSPQPEPPQPEPAQPRAVATSSEDTQPAADRGTGEVTPAVPQPESSQPQAVATTDQEPPVPDHNGGESRAPAGSPVTPVTRGPRLVPRTRRAMLLTTWAGVLALSIAIASFVLLRNGDRSSGGSSSTYPLPTSVLTGHTHPVDEMAFSADGKTLTTISRDDPTVRRWNVSTGQSTAAFTIDTAKETMAISADGQTLATAGVENKPGAVVRLWNLTTGQERKTLTIPGIVGASEIALNSDGSLLAVASGLAGTKYDNPIHLWNVSTDKEAATLTGHINGVQYLSFSRDGKVLLSGGVVGDPARLWNVSTGRRRATLTTHDKELVSRSAFSSDGKQLVIARRDDVKVFDVATGRSTAPISGATIHDVIGVGFGPGGEALVAEDAGTRVEVRGSRGVVAVLSGQPTESPSLLYPLVGKFQPTAVISPDGTTFAVSGGDGAVRLGHI